MQYKKISYYIIDAIIVSGLLMSLFIEKDYSLIPFFVAALALNLIHQIWGEKKYFRGMFDQGRPAYIKYYYPFTRWALTILAISLVAAGILNILK